LHLSPPTFFFFKKIKNKKIKTEKTTKTCFTGKEKSSPSIQGKGKPHLRERGLTIL
jgi:hypothetical protein